MEYNIKSHPTLYNGVQFRSRLEARWAAFFDLAGWKWEYEPIDLGDWVPDFRVVIGDYFPQDESRSPNYLWVEVKPFYSIDEFDGHPIDRYMNPGTYIAGAGYYRDTFGKFGINPEITQWWLYNDSGGAHYSMSAWESEWESLWKQAGNITQWKGPVSA